MNKETNNNNGGVEKQTQIIPKEQIVIGSTQSTLRKENGRILSKRGLSPAALIEFLSQPKWIEVAEKYDPTSPHRSQRNLCSIEAVTKMLRRVAYEADIKKVRSWLPYAFRESLKRDAFIVVQQAGHGKQVGTDGQVTIHHGETIGVCLCPVNPSPALRELALKQIQKRVDAGDMNKKQAAKMRGVLGDEI